MNTIPHPAQKRSRPLQVLSRAVESMQFSEAHADEWRNKVAADLNALLGRAEYELDMCGDESDISFARAVLRICERVAEFEEIRPARSATK